jgi:hypothetical protein
MQQLTLLVVPLVLFAWLLLARGHHGLAGCLLALTIIKPQLILPLFLWLLLWALQRRCWTLIATFAATTGLLLAATERVVPGWFSRWRFSLRGYSATEHAALPLEHLFGHWLGLLLTLFLATGAAAALWLLRRVEANSLPFAYAVSLALAIAPCIFPMQPLMIYNNALLFPAVLLLFRKPADALTARVRQLAILQLALDFAFIPLASLGETLSRPSNLWLSLPFLDFLLPSLLALMLILGILRQNCQCPTLTPN